MTIDPDSGGHALPPRGRGALRTLPHALDRFTLFDHIGRGGMADIYLARAPVALGGSRLVVIKEILPSLSDAPRFNELLISEAKLAARLCHANIVRIEDLGRSGDTLFIAMEYVEGFDLRELLRRCARERVPMPVDFSLLVVTEMLRALDYAHRRRSHAGAPLGIVHRDVSPSNVLVAFDGQVKLCDFGIARANDAHHRLPPEAIEGKAGYMSPEQARGEPLDARADVFAAGIILWELLSGRRLYRTEGGGRLLDLARQADVPSIPRRGLPEEDALAAIVGRALERDRDGRYADAASMLRDLEEYAAAAQMTASPLRFGDWLMTHFGAAIVAGRRARERAMRALDNGPPATVLAVAPAPAPVPVSVPAPAPPARRLRATVALLFAAVLILLVVASCVAAYQST